MLVCSCNVISKSVVEEVIRGFLNDDPWQLITPGKVYHAMKKRGQCCGCFPNIINIIVAEIETFHHKAQTPIAEILPFIAKLRSEYERTQAIREHYQAHKHAALS